MGLFDGVFKSGGSADDEYREQCERMQVEKMMMMAREQRHIDRMAQMGITQQAYNQAMQQKVMNQAVKPLPRFDPNKSEAFQIPLSQAVTMWQVKHGDKWFDGHQPTPREGDDFYADVFGRLKTAGLFENIDGWYRLKENVETLLANH